MTLEQVRARVAADLDAVDRLIRGRLRSEVALADRMARYIVESGGKRLRAMLVLLCGRVLGGLRDRDASLLLAAVIEFIHTATLLHDDVVDASEVRRGRATANTVWSDGASVLAGDFFYSRAFEMITEIDRAPVARTLAAASNAIAEGELMELMHAGDAELDEARYLTIIEGKTARLFEASCEAAGRIEGADDGRLRALGAYGRLLGAAFQITDDAIDYREDNPEADKSVGDDLACGRMTLPFIYALREAGADDRALLLDALGAARRDRIPEVCAAMRRCGALGHALGRAREFADRARAELDALEASEWRDALAAVAEFAVSRGH